MVKEIKQATAATLSTAEKLWNVVFLIAQSVAAVVLTLCALELTNTYHRGVVVAVACVLGANVVLTLFRLQRDK
jgi:malate/lactate dehydrogenase